jgi:DNA processing protein
VSLPRLGAKVSYSNTATLLNSISPYEEMVAYETLWAIDGMTEKKLSEIFKSNLLPSEALKQEVGFFDDILRQTVEKYLAKIDTKFSIAVNGDFQYPEKLREAQYPLELFYYRGELGLISSKCVSVVGSRKVSKEGIRVLTRQR